MKGSLRLILIEFVIVALEIAGIILFLQSPGSLATQTEAVPQIFLRRDDTMPEIIGADTITIDEYDSVDILSQYEVTDENLIDVVVRGNYDTKTPGTYDLEIVATDEFLNIAKKPIQLVVNEIQPPAGQNKYFIRVNRELNVTMIYKANRNGEYNILVKTFLNSTGKLSSKTPIGTFTVSDRYETISFSSGQWGHYALRITGHVFFHSVPYYKKTSPWDSLNYNEFNKLGQWTTAGCVRHAIVDAKWIYDNIPKGTKVEVYNSDSLPEGVTKPEGIKIDTNSPNRGWDPTDPDSRNPWNS